MRPEARSSFLERRLTNYVFAGTVALILFLLYATYNNITDYRAGVEEARRLNRLKIATDGMMSGLRDAETGLRGFMLTYDQTYLGPYRSAMPDFVRSKLDAINIAGNAERAELEALILMADSLQERWSMRLERLDDGKEIELTEAQMLDDRKLMDRTRKAYERFGKSIIERRDLLLRTEVQAWKAPQMIVVVSAIALLALGSLFWRLSTALMNSEQAWKTADAKNMELVQALDHLNHLRIELKNVLDTSPNGVMTLRSLRGPDGRIFDFEWKTANAMAIEMMGHGELIGKRLLETLPEKRGLGFFAEYVKVVETGSDLKRDVMREFHGADTWFRKHAVRTEDGFLVTFTDITEQRRMEQVRLEGDKLALTSQITRTVAHEVRNPLTNLHLAVEQLQEELPGMDAELKPYFGIIERNLQRIGDLIKGMLESTRQRDIHARKCTLEEIVEGVVAHIADRVELKEMRIERDLPADLPSVMVDLDLMVLAITNIAVNAIEAMEAGKGLLRFEAALRGDEITLHIIDNGRGMPEEGIKKIFQPFYSGRPGGLGLGLTATRSILTGHGIRMEVTSLVGEGTAFELQFPVKVVVVPA